ncbi:coiled-coil domain-containing protein 106-like isoform X2 [Epinephelus fuscoguttatus]|uniref:coiled-coil domain-containing protein 106-like isoform X2 n=1 Tax=Epinephelus fuscoguttatus TaxID=293821 RepID=UPI0020D04FE7|nr:coiled-coil domain-containing protein 106-like isoform X2 [Epinephelus fuscoguttatus]
MQVGVGRPSTDLLQYLHLVMPNTRKTKRKQHTAPEENPALLIQSDNDQVIQSDNDGKEIQQNAPTKAPTKAPTIAKLKGDFQKLKGENQLLKEEIRLLKEENRFLKEQRDFNQEKALHTEVGHTTSKGQRKMRNGDSSDSSDSDDSYEDRKRKCKKKHKKHGSSDSSDDDWKKSKSKKPSSFGKRVLSPEDVVHRYKAVLKVFRRNRSMTNTCEELGVDRNTIAGTAVIADVMIATEGTDFGELPLFKEKQTLANYAKLCKAFVDANRPLQEKN